MLKYFLNLRSNLIIYDSVYAEDGVLSGDYIRCLTRVIQDNDAFGVTLWIDSANATQLELNEMVLKDVELEIEGFITILPDTRSFLLANYYATQNSIVRLKGKRMLFLTDREDPKVLLADDILTCKFLGFSFFFYKK